jgi:sugar phosphate isomerase/epimerase
MSILSRRDFIKSTSTAVAASYLLPYTEFISADINTGLALYTLREEMAKDIDRTLEIVALTGYNWVEAAGYSDGLFYNLKPSDFRNRVDNSGLKLISSHCGVNKDNIVKVIEDSAEAGVRYLVLPSLTPEWRKSADGFRKAADFFNIAGEKCSKAGMKFCFHNHTTEFKKTGGVIPFDLLLEGTDPSLVSFELDLCWITAANQNPVVYFINHPGRFELLHLKDMTKGKKDATLGEGVIDFKPIFALAGKAGMKYFFVEQDNCKTHSSFESIKISRDYLLQNFNNI